jgi:hypothetical protein
MQGVERLHALEEAPRERKADIGTITHAKVL